ncbi:MAG: hypothetical protein N2053_10310 [Chitinispirillaceae bacterium]|nr:hypothetical protein [Chitinispirillaceae bacterium]
MKNLDKTIDKILSLYPPDTKKGDERLKRFFLSFCFFIAAIPITFFGIRNLLLDKQGEAVVVFFIVLMLISLIVVLNRAKSYYLTIRIIIVLIASALFYELYIGGGNGFAFMWIMLMPLSIVFMIGFKEGFFWVLGIIIVMSILMFGKFGYVYKNDFSARFIIIFSILTLLSCCIEFLRERYLNQLITEKEELKKALDQIHILKGMVPICASCKRIRDDQGFWTQIETYIKEHSEIEFSHGLCPECQAKIYPSLKKEQKTLNNSLK